MKTRKTSVLLRCGALIGCLLLTLLSGCAKEPPIKYLEGTEFPVGIFRSGDLVFRFYRDGTFRWFDGARGWGYRGKYGVNGDLYAEMIHGGPDLRVPATYAWAFDGELLTFELIGKDLNGVRWPHYKPTYRYMEKIDDASEVEENKSPEFPIGRFVLDSDEFYAIEFDEDGTWRDYDTDGDDPLGIGKYVTNRSLFSI